MDGNLKGKIVAGLTGLSALVIAACSGGGQVSGTPTEVPTATQSSYATATAKPAPTATSAPYATATPTQEGLETKVEPFVWVPGDAMLFSLNPYKADPIQIEGILPPAVNPNWEDKIYALTSSSSVVPAGLQLGRVAKSVQSGISTGNAPALGLLFEVNVKGSILPEHYVDITLLNNSRDRNYGVTVHIPRVGPGKWEFLIAKDGSAYLAKATLQYAKGPVSITPINSRLNEGGIPSVEQVLAAENRALSASETARKYPTFVNDPCVMSFIDRNLTAATMFAPMTCITRLYN